MLDRALDFSVIVPTYDRPNELACCLDSLAALDFPKDRDLCDRWIGVGFQMIFVSGAVAYHAHSLSFSTFWMQHVAYGRGARRFYLAHRLRDRNSSTIEGKFYSRLLQQLPRALRRKRRPWSLACLMVVWQAANVAGFALETLFPKRSPSLNPRKDA